MGVEVTTVRAEAARPSARRGSQVKQMLIGAVAGGVGALLALSLAPELAPAEKAALREQLGGALPFAAAAVSVLLMWVVIAVHEAGHVLAGLAVGFRFRLFVAGPLRVEREEAGAPVKAGLNHELALYGGIAATLPADTRDLPRRFVWVFAGGPLASLALALAAWGAVAGFLSGAPVAVRMVTGMLGLLSGVIGMATLIPMRTSGFASDGARLLRMARGGPAAKREAATLTLIALATAQVRPRDWPRETVERAAAIADGTLEECSGRMLAYGYALDLGDTAWAGRELDRALELVDAYPKPMAPALWAEAAYFEGAVRRDAGRARAALARVPEKSFVVKPFDRARAEAAIALAEGDAAAARAHAERARATLLQPSPHRLAMVDDLLRAADAVEREASATKAVAHRINHR